VLERGADGLLALLDRKGISVPKPFRVVLSCEGGLTAEKAVGAAAEVLDDEKVVEGAQKVIDTGSQVLSTLKKLGESSAIKQVVSMADSAFTNPEVEAGLFQALADFDPDTLVAQAENAMSSANAREALVNSIKDQLLDFVLQVLPKVEVPPLDGDTDSMSYNVSNLDLSGIDFKKENVRIQLSENLHKMKQAAKEKLAKHKRKSDRRVAEADDANGRALTDEEAVLIEAWGLQACFSGVKFSYEKKTFPRLATNGLLDLTANGVSVQTPMIPPDRLFWTGYTPDRENR
jgi:hypothetical protein